MPRLSIAMVFSLVACGSVHSAPPSDAPADVATPPSDAPADAPVPPIDAPPATPPVLAGIAKIHGANTAKLTLPMTVPAGDNRFLIVTVGIGSGCVDPIQIVLGASYAAMPLARLDAISGTQCGPNGARSEQWRMVAPPVGTNDVVVQLSAPGLTVHVGALVFTGVNQASPCARRAPAAARAPMPRSPCPARSATSSWPRSARAG